MRALIVLSLSCLLAACGADLSDLIDYTEDLKQNTQVNIEEYPEFRTVEAVGYASAGQRSPFQKIKQTVSNVREIQTENCLQPEHGRPKQKLEAYGIDALQMSGVFSNGKHRWVLIKANDGSLHKAKRGQYIGLFHGKIQRIEEQQVIFEEMIPDGAGCWKRKMATLNMASITGESDV